MRGKILRLFKDIYLLIPNILNIKVMIVVEINLYIIFRLINATDVWYNLSLGV